MSNTPIPLVKFSQPSSESVFNLLKDNTLLKDTSLPEWKALSRWAFWDNPFRGNAPPGWCYQVDKEDLAFIGATYVPLKVFDKTITAPLYGPICVSTKCRESLFALKFTKAYLSLNHSKFGFSTHFNSNMSLFWVKLGGTACQESKNTYSYTVSPIISTIYKVANRLKLNTSYTKLLDKIKSRAKPYTFKHQGLSVTVSNRLDVNKQGQINTLCEQFMKDISVGIVRNWDYLHWRYSSHPETYYYVYTQNSSQTLTSLFVLAINRYGEAKLCEFITNTGVEKILKEQHLLLHKVAKHLGIGRLVSKYISGRHKVLMSELGYKITTKQYAQYILRGLDSNIKELDALYTFGDASLI